MAVVAVLLIHMERNAVVSMKPSIKLQRTTDQSNQLNQEPCSWLNLYLLVTLYRTVAVIISCPPSIASEIQEIFACGIQKLGKFACGIRNPESWALESGIQLKESRIPLTIEIQNPSSTDKNWNPVPGIRNPPCGIQNPRLSRIRLHGARTPSYCFKRYPEVNFTWVIYDAILPSVKRSQCYRVNTLPFLKLTDISSCA